MRHGALFHLLARRMTIGLVGTLLVTVVIALALVLADDSRSVGIPVGFCIYICVVLGNYLGGQIMLAIGCSFAWTLPQFRRETLREFVACGIAVSAVPGLMVTIFGGASMFALLASAAGFAAFSVSGAVCVIQEAAPLFMLGCGVVLWLQMSVPLSVLNAPLIVIPITLAISAAALHLGFGSRTFRWSSLGARQQPVGPISYQLHTLLRMPTRSAQPVGPDSSAPSRARYVGPGVVGRVVYCYHAIKRRWLFANIVAAVVLFAVMTASFVWLNRVTDSPAANPNPWFGLVMVGGIFSFFGHRGCSRVALPWSRRQHLAVAYTIDLFDTLAFLLATCPFAIGVYILIAPADTSMVGSLARAGAATAVFLPVFQWPGGPSTGGLAQALGRLQVTSWVTLVRPLAIVSAVGLCVYGLPKIASSLAGQAIVLGMLLVTSQALYWLKLRRAFTTRDLVDEER
jgi:hypothetical protein